MFNRELFRGSIFSITAVLNQNLFTRNLVMRNFFLNWGLMSQSSIVLGKGGDWLIPLSIHPSRIKLICGDQYSKSDWASRVCSNLYLTLISYGPWKYTYANNSIFRKEIFHPYLYCFNRKIQWNDDALRHLSRTNKS